MRPGSISTRASAEMEVDPLAGEHVCSKGNRSFMRPVRYEDVKRLTQLRAATGS